MILSETNYRKLTLTIASIITGFFLLTALCGCPYKSVYQIDNEPQVQTDEAFSGNWETIMIEENGRQRIVRMNLSRKNDFEYNIYFCGFFGRVNKKNIPQADTIRGAAFMSLVGNRQFLNVNIDTRIYIAEFIYENDQITLLPLSDYFTSFVVKSNQELRERITYHFRTRLYPLYDESFALRKMKRVTDNL